MATKVILAGPEAKGLRKIKVSACATETCDVSREHWHTFQKAIDSKGLSKTTKERRNG